MRILRLLILVVLEAHANEDARPLLASRSGSFVIEEVYETDGPAEWIVSKTDPELRVRLTKAHDAEPYTYTISPDEKWICADVHYGSRMAGIRLYRLKSGVSFEQVVADEAVWEFIGKALKGENVGAEMIRFVGWSPDSARVVLSVPVAVGEEKEGRIWSWYFYYNVSGGMFELTDHLREINARTLRILERGEGRKGLPTVVTGEPVGPMPPSGEIRTRYEESERRMDSLYKSIMDREIPERLEQLKENQSTWLARRDDGAVEFSRTGSEQASRRQQHLTDANESRIRELEYHLSTLQ
jgi:Lysozyme inhibitor LprI